MFSACSILQKLARLYGIRLDPKSGKLGPDSKYFQHTPDEAAKLLRAAGKFGLEQEYTMWTPVDPAWQRQTEVVAQMLQEGGHFKLKTGTLDYNSAYQPQYLRSNNQFQGFAPFQVFSGLPDWNMVMWNHTNPGARNDYISDWNNVASSFAAWIIDEPSSSTLSSSSLRGWAWAVGSVRTVVFAGSSIARVRRCGTARALNRNVHGVIWI